MTKPRLIILAVLPILLAACSTTRSPAPVQDRTAGTRPSMATAPTTQRHVDTDGYYTVKRGDTLIQISLEFGQNYRDIVLWNNLANPNDIKIDQVLRVLPPEEGSQTASVATTSGVEVRPLGNNGAPAQAASSTPPSPSSAQASVPNKSAPRGDKRPYTDSTLAELQKPDSVPAPAAPVAVTPTPTVARSESRQPGAATAPAAGDDNVAWIWPADGKVVAPFGEGRRGIAISGQMGQPVLAAGAGKVLYAGSGIRGYGNLVIVKHTNNLLSAYAHNKTIFVKEDQTVTQGQKIAEMGNSDADAVKLHFEIRHQGKPVDPSKYLPSR